MWLIVWSHSLFCSSYSSHKIRTYVAVPNGYSYSFEFFGKYVLFFTFSKAHIYSETGTLECFLNLHLRTLSSSLCLSSVSSGGGPGPLKPVLPPQPLPVSQPLGGTSQPPPPINTTHPYQVMEKQPYSVWLPGETNSCRLLLAQFQTAVFMFLP